MYVILWRFRVRPGCEPEFEAAYGDDGSWARLFRSGVGYLGTELMRGTDGTYLTIDRWTSGQAYRSFQEDHAARIAELDALGLTLTLEETPLGEIEA